MLGIGFGEMVVIGVLVLLAAGPDKIPIMVKTVARLYRQLRRAAMEIRASTGIDDFLRDEELKELAEIRKQKLLAMSKAPLNKPGALNAPMGYGKPIAGKPEPYAHDASGGDAYGEPRGLTPEQRRIEAPPEGVDIAEARLATSALSLGSEEAAATPVPVSASDEASGEAQ